MNIVRTTCPNCRSPLEFPREFSNIICVSCQSSFRVREYGGTINLDSVDESGVGPPMSERQEAEAAALVESRLIELDELIVEAEAEIEAVRGKEQSGPLRMGCAFFGLFCAVIAVLTLFMVAARSYVGSLVFYAAIAVIVIIGVARIRRKAQTAAELTHLRSTRERLQSGLADLRTERSRIHGLQEKLRASIGPNREDEVEIERSQDSQ